MHNEHLVNRPIGSFDETILPHLDAAHNLARWLVRGGDDAEDVVQEACLRAFRYFDTFRGGNARAWLLTIVRTTAFSWLQKNRAQQLALSSMKKYIARDVTPSIPKPCCSRARTHNYSSGP